MWKIMRQGEDKFAISNKSSKYKRQDSTKSQATALY